jgi:two-component system chemotaxis response regulator CheB
MRKIRVLIVDDAVVVRRLVSEVLNGDAAIEVVGTAPNGRIALAKIPQVNPDLVTLDIEMPEMDGLETLRELRKSYPKLPVIMFSTLTQRGAASTLDALALGATDYVTKPSNVGSVTQVLARIRDELIPKIKTFCRAIIGGDPALASLAAKLPPSSLHPSPVLAPRVVSPAQRVDVLAIGVSTGGPNALSALLPQLPADLPIPILIVQHMPPIFTRLLAERLSGLTGMHIEEAGEHEMLAPGRAWLAPGNYHMIVHRESSGVYIHLNQDPPENSCRPAVDVLFRSVAAAFGQHALAAVLTGMGHDGLRGCELIREAGGQIVVQDEASSVVWGMPGAVAKAGLADQILSLDKLGDGIMRRVMEFRPKWSMVT